MKLRLRSLQSKETHKLEVPNDCSVQRLKESLSRYLSSTSSLRLSLNRKDDLSSPSPDASLLYIGITSGDLIYYDVSADQQGNSSSDLQNNFRNDIVDMESDSVVQGFADVLKSEKSIEIPRESVSMDCTNQNNELREIGGKGKAILIEDEKLEIGNCIGVDSGSDCKRLSEPYFLKMVLCEGLGNDFSDSKLVFLAIHAVFLDFGFVGFDPISGLRVDNFDIMKEQTSLAFTTTVSYTVPELLSNDSDTESVVLNIHTLGHYVNVYGSLAKGQVGLHKLKIDKSRFVPAIGQFGGLNVMNSTMASAEKVVLEFWKVVKDGLALPLMIELCGKTGLALPPCFTRVPAEIKFRILELLSGKDIARMACVCKETCNLSDNNKLWEEKCKLEFGNATEATGRFVKWKDNFVSSWYEAKKQRRGIRIGSAYRIRSAYSFAPYPFGNRQHVPRVGPNPFGIPPMIGDDREPGGTRPFALFSRAPNWRIH